MKTKYIKVLINMINQSLWWHVTPQDPDAYKKRGKFLASTYLQASFYGRPNDFPEKVNISNPICETSEMKILKILFPTDYKKLDIFHPGYREGWYEERINLDSKMYKQAKSLGYDAIVLLGSNAKKYLMKNRKPVSIELNLCK